MMYAANPAMKKKIKTVKQYTRRITNRARKKETWLGREVEAYVHAVKKNLDKSPKRRGKIIAVFDDTVLVDFGIFRESYGVLEVAAEKNIKLLKQKNQGV